MQWVLIDAVVWQEGNLIRDLIYEHQTSNVIRMRSSFLGSEKQTIVAGADMGEEGTLLADRANEFALTVENENLAV